ncbi:MAG: hypothetical protein JJT81_17735 [Rubellimicrobium sp.]|nr:hypothetical protein [Rubellimicrobium sp.]
MSLHSVWVYPRDLANRGQEEAQAPVRATGAGMVSLATSCHAGRFLQPGNPRRRFHDLQDGTIYDRPDPAILEGAGIRPLASDSVLQDGAAAHGLARGVEGGGLALSSWTVCPGSADVTAPRCRRGAVTSSTPNGSSRMAGNWA